MNHETKNSELIINEKINIIAKNKADIEKIDNQIKKEELEKKKEFFTLQANLNSKITEKTKTIDDNKKKSFSTINDDISKQGTNIQVTYK